MTIANDQAVMEVKDIEQPRDIIRSGDEEVERLQKRLKEVNENEKKLLQTLEEKDRTIDKMETIVEEYGQLMQNIFAKKERMVEKYKKMVAAMKQERDVTADHLASLEITFSDLHRRYEKAKSIITTLEENKKGLLMKKEDYALAKKIQEAMYAKMKDHAIELVEDTNRQLIEVYKNNIEEKLKLKAQVKLEEITLDTVNKKLEEKYKENRELTKICDDLLHAAK